MATTYLFTGSELEEKQEHITQLKKSFFNTYADAQIDKIFPMDFDMWIARIATASLFNTGTWAEIKEANQLNANQCKALKQLITDGPDDLCMVIQSDETKLASLDKAVPASHKKVFWELYKDKQEAALARFARNAGKVLTREAIALILELVPGQLTELRAAVEQLCVLCDGPTIDAVDVRSTLEHTRIESAFTLFETMATAAPARALEQALGIYQAMRDAGSGSAWELIPPLIWQFRRLAQFAQLRKTASEADAAASVRVLGKAAAIRGAKQLDVYRQALQRWNYTSCKQILLALEDTEIELRRIPGALHHYRIEELLYRILILKGAELRDYPPVFIKAQY